jgi:hypothetical protein
MPVIRLSFWTICLMERLRVIEGLLLPLIDLLACIHAWPPSLMRMEFNQSRCGYFEYR